ncbi:Ribonuclease H-like domain containing protein [Parasponia andersonii]|uniref:Ribonuclease H-like domain containing protein n=1 Tax=Parasponia andersonii TaxID=3476 RepID=A0A2P5BYW3_PARAD|nr:Ribonuclease H-like domain containing protein [Parasponia andersonii]
MPLDHGKFKLNIDAASFAEICCFGIGAIVRDHIGRVVFTGCVKILGLFDPLTVELLAMREGLVLVSNFRLQIQMLENDSSNVVSLVNSAIDSLTTIDLITRDIKSIMSISECGTCNFIPRSGNEVAYKLAKLSSAFATLMY